MLWLSPRVSPATPAIRHLVHQRRVAFCHVKVAMMAGQRRPICTALTRPTRFSPGDERFRGALAQQLVMSPVTALGKMVVKPTNRNAVLIF